LREALVESRGRAILHIAPSGVMGVEFSRAGLGVAGAKNGSAVTFSARGKPRAQLLHGGPLRVAVVSGDGRFAVTAGGRRAVVWDPRNGKGPRTNGAGSGDETPEVPPRPPQARHAH